MSVLIARLIAGCIVAGCVALPSEVAVPLLLVGAGPVCVLWSWGGGA